VNARITEYDQSDTLPADHKWNHDQCQAAKFLLHLPQPAWNARVGSHIGNRHSLTLIQYRVQIIACVRQTFFQAL
jgi:hypothetical protein